MAMNWTIPGTTLTVPRSEAVHIAEQFGSMFFGGGIMLGQVTAISGLESHMVQNWVRRGFLAPPIRKRYDMGQLCRILTINALRASLSLESICSLLQYINGQLTDHSDDLINDAQLYFMFVRLAARAQQLIQAEDRDRILQEELSGYEEPLPGARERVKTVLSIMLTAYLAARMREQACQMLKTIEKEKIV